MYQSYNSFGGRPLACVRTHEKLLAIGLFLKYNINGVKEMSIHAE